MARELNMEAKHSIEKQTAHHGCRKYRTKRESREHSRNAASPDEL